MHLSQLMPPLIFVHHIDDVSGEFGMVWDGSVDHMSCASLSINNHISWSHCHHTYKLTRFSYSMFCLNGTSNSTIKPSHGTPLKINPSDWNPVWWNSTLQLQCTLRNLIWLPFLPHTKKITFGAADHQSWWSWHVPNLHLCRGRGGNRRPASFNQQLHHWVMSVAETSYLKVASVRWLPDPCHVLYVLFGELNAIPKPILAAMHFFMALVCMGESWIYIYYYNTNWHIYMRACTQIMNNTYGITFKQVEL